MACDFDSGGVIPESVTVVYNGTAQAERVLSAEEWDALSDEES